jgi:hypothetical protein
MSDVYNELKSIILGEDFPWFWVDNTCVGHYATQQSEANNFSFFSHVLLERPGTTTMYPRPCSNLLPQAETVFREICDSKNIIPDVLYRANVNLVLPSTDRTASPLHRDHDFPHKNMIVYLTDCNGGPTMVHGQEDYYGKEDEVYIFEGLHQMKPPTSDRRVVLVYTFI